MKYTPAVKLNSQGKYWPAVIVQGEMCPDTRTTIQEVKILTICDYHKKEYALAHALGYVDRITTKKGF